RDLDENLILIGGGASQFQIDIQGGYADCSTWVDYQNGTYAMIYRVSRAGTLEISIYYQGELVGQSPYNVLIGPGSLDPLATVLEGAGLGLAIAGHEAGFIIKTCDRFGNMLRNGGAT